MYKRLFRRLFASSGGHAGQLEQARAFLDTITLALREGKTLYVFVSAGGLESGVLLPGGSDNPVVEYLYNFAAAAVLRIDAELEIAHRVCGSCSDLQCCQLTRDKKYPCKFFDPPVCDNELSHAG